MIETNYKDIFINGQDVYKKLKDGTYKNCVSGQTMQVIIKYALELIARKSMLDFIGLLQKPYYQIKITFQW